MAHEHFARGVVIHPAVAPAAETPPFASAADVARELDEMSAAGWTYAGPLLNQFKFGDAVFTQHWLIFRREIRPQQEEVNT